MRDIDPNGRLALVSHWRRPLRLFDLRRLAWIDIELPRRYWLMTRSVPPRLSADQRLFHAVPNLRSETVASDIRTHDLRTGAIRLISRHAPFGSTGVSATNNRYWYVTDTQQVAITNNGTQVAVTLDHVWLVEPLPRKVIHAAHVDGERDLLAAGSWSEISLHRIVDGTLERVGYAKTEANGDVKWIAVAGPWLVAAIATDPVLRTTRIEVYRLDASLSIGALEHRYTGSPLGAAALSRDGRYLALAIDGVLVVHELGTARAIGRSKSSSRSTRRTSCSSAAAPSTASRTSSAAARVSVASVLAPRCRPPRTTRTRCAARLAPRI